MAPTRVGKSLWALVQALFEHHLGSRALADASTDQAIQHRAADETPVERLQSLEQSMARLEEVLGRICEKVGVAEDTEGLEVGDAKE